MEGHRPRLVPRGPFRALGLLLLALTTACPSPEEPPACPVGQVQDVDTEECVPEHCGTEPWGLIERTGETIHVAPWGDDDWDGSERWPYRTIQQGADEADGGLVAVAGGTYVENLELDSEHNGVEIAGRCADLVVIDGSGEEAETVWVMGGTVAIRGVAVTGGQIGVWVERLGFGGTAELQLEEVALVQNTDTGLFVVGHDASARVVACEITDTQPLPDGTLGRGISLQEGASLVARSLLLEGNHDVGLIAVQAGTAAYVFT